ncbi:MAG: hydroxyisourate hydrolase [Aeromicrobium sp.]|uniref:hydroxyisourate hydrolase n=1 Tax=Aeromicrobium sp. TaxID=1871063 RepID=UPI0039E58284
MTTLTTHVLDAVLGRPAAGLEVTLTGPDGAAATAATDDDGRIAFDGDLDPGEYALEFATGAWFAAADRAYFHPRVSIAFAVAENEPHTHIALLLSPFAYTTYKGS